MVPHLARKRKAAAAKKLAAAKRKEEREDQRAAAKAELKVQKRRAGELIRLHIKKPKRLMKRIGTETLTDSCALIADKMKWEITPTVASDIIRNHISNWWQVGRSFNTDLPPLYTRMMRFNYPLSVRMNSMDMRINGTTFSEDIKYATEKIGTHWDRHKVKVCVFNNLPSFNELDELAVLGMLQKMSVLFLSCADKHMNKGGEKRYRGTHFMEHLVSKTDIVACYIGDNGHMPGALALYKALGAKKRAIERRFWLHGKTPPWRTLYFLYQLLALKCRDGSVDKLFGKVTCRPKLFGSDWHKCMWKKAMKKEWKRKQRERGKDLLPLAPEDYKEALRWERPIAAEDTNPKTLGMLDDAAPWMEFDLKLASKRKWGDAAANWGQLRTMGVANRTTTTTTLAMMTDGVTEEEDDDALYVPEGAEYYYDFEGRGF